MAALLGTNTALIFVPRIEQAKTPNPMRELALCIVAAALPFQGIYFLIYTFLLEHEARLPDERIHKLNLASALCQVISYASLVGVAMMWYDLCVDRFGLRRFFVFGDCFDPHCYGPRRDG